jgi:hypothetical protein
MKKYLNFLVGEKESILEQHRSAIKKTLLMEDEGILPDKTILGTGADKYDYKREKGRYYTKQKNTSSWTDITGTKYEQAVRTNIFKDISTNVVATSSKVPFTNRTEGDKFRAWVNINYPNVAKQTQLDPSSPYFNNTNITSAWNYKVGDKTLGSIYQSGSKPEIKDVKTKQTSDSAKAAAEYSKFEQSEYDPFGLKAGVKRTIEQLPKELVPQIFKGSGGERLNKEVYYINSRKEYDGKPFFVVDPRMKIVAAFDSNHKLVKMSQTIEGQDPQRTDVLTYEEWCKVSGGKRIKTKNPNTNQIIEKCSVKLDYPSLEKIRARASSAGIYKGAGVKYEKGYLGKQGVGNLLSIKTLEGESIPMSIHALVPKRIVPDAILKKYLSLQKEKNQIPEEYTNLVNSLILSGTFDKSSGCFNVDPDFINDPAVLKVAESDPYIFVMSESSDYYLVQVDSDNGAQFFNGLKGDGDFCKPPTSVAKEAGGRVIDITS